MNDFLSCLPHLTPSFAYALTLRARYLVQNPCSFFISRISIIVPARISRNNKGIKDTNNNDVRLF